MPYSSNNNNLSIKQLFFALRKKIFKKLAKTFPYNRIRVWALRNCGFEVGNSVYIGEEIIVTNILEDNSCRLFIGDRVAIAQRVTIILDSDPNWSKLINKVSVVRGVVQIEDDAWIGAGAIILPNVTIGSMSIVGAGSIVTKDVPPNTIVAGNPARIIRTIDI